MKIQAKDDPLAPIATAVWALTALLVAALVLILGATIFGSGSFLSFGGDDVCTTASTGKLGYTVPDGPHPTGVLGVRPGVSQFPPTVQLCVLHPSTALRVKGSLGPFASLLFLLGALGLTGLTIRAARDRGVFNHEVARRTRLLGWFLLLGSLLSAFLESVSSGLVVTDAARHQSWSVGLATFAMPWTLVVVGLGVLSVARVLGRGVAMQRDLDTVI